METEETKKEPRYYFAEEVANVISHGLAGLLSVAAVVLLVMRACSCSPAEFRAAEVVGCAVFGGSLVLLYFSSTFYHALLTTSCKNFLLIMDRVAIYILIAGSYTFFSLSVLHGPVGYRLLIEVWALAGLGTMLFILFREKLGWFSLFLYLAMGWLAVTEFSAFAAIPATPFYLIVAGGLAYTVGSVFYALQHFKWMHFVWHLFVMAGSAFHVAAACWIL